MPDCTGHLREMKKSFPKSETVMLANVKLLLKLIALLWRNDMRSRVAWSTTIGGNLDPAVSRLAATGMQTGSSISLDSFRATLMKSDNGSIERPSRPECSQSVADTPFAHTMICKVLSYHRFSFPRRKWRKRSSDPQGFDESRHTMKAADAMDCRVSSFLLLVSLRMDRIYHQAC